MDTDDVAFNFDWIVFGGGSGLRRLWPKLIRRCMTDAVRPMRFLIVVAVTDDGGSSRAIMDSVIGGLAIGDCRNVLLSITDAVLRVAAPSTCGAAQSRRELHRILSTRLPRESNTNAEAFLNDNVIPSLRVGASDEIVNDNRADAIHHPKQLCVEALSVFQSWSQKDGNGFPPFQYRNASVGNLVLTGLLLMELLADTHCQAASGPLQRAVDRMWSDIVGAPHLLRSANVNAIFKIAPSLDYCQRTAHSSADGSVTLPLPKASLSCRWGDGAVVCGQRSISYGAKDEDPLVTCKTAASHAPAGGRGWSATKHEVESLSIISGDGMDVCSNAVVTQVMLQVPRQPLCMLARGSLLTSSLAAAIPYLSGRSGSLRTDVAHHNHHCQPMQVCVMVNGSADVETQSMHTLTRIANCVRRVLNRGLPWRLSELWLPVAAAEDGFWCEDDAMSAPSDSFHIKRFPASMVQPPSEAAIDGPSISPLPSGCFAFDDDAVAAEMVLMCASRA